MKRIVDVLVFGGVVIAIVLALVLAPPARGPLYQWQSDGGYSGVGMPVRPGQIGSSALLDIPAQSRPVELLAVRPLHPGDARGVTLRYGVTTGRGMGIGGARGWHAAAWELHPIAGYVIPPHVRADVMVGAASQEHGAHAILGFVIDYRIGAFTYSAPQQMQLDICVGMRQCPDLP